MPLGPVSGGLKRTTTLAFCIPAQDFTESPSKLRDAAADSWIRIAQLLSAVQHLTGLVRMTWAPLVEEDAHAGVSYA
jgi:hypothetical protein